MSEGIAQLKAQRAQALLVAQDAALERATVQAQRDAVSRTLAGRREQLLSLKKQQSTVEQAVADVVTVAELVGRKPDAALRAWQEAQAKELVEQQHPLTTEAERLEQLLQSPDERLTLLSAAEREAGERAQARSRAATVTVWACGAPERAPRPWQGDQRVAQPRSRMMRSPSSRTRARPARPSART